MNSVSKSDIDKNFGKILREFRIKNSLTQEQLSELIDISQKALSSIETGENFVKAETSDKILKTFDITAEELFATNQLKDSAELLEMINKNIAKLENISFAKVSLFIELSSISGLYVSTNISTESFNIAIILSRILSPSNTVLLWE